MAKRIHYRVRATLPSEEIAREYVAWLEDGHVDDVVDAGAHSGMIVVVEAEGGESIQVETHYVFATRARFDEYLTRHAPRLREEGLDRFGSETGVVFERTIGEIL
jgi:hypothetical protein